MYLFYFLTDDFSVKFLLKSQNFLDLFRIHNIIIGSDASGMKMSFKLDFPFCFFKSLMFGIPFVLHHLTIDLSFVSISYSSLSIPIIFC
ncbi:Ovule protein [Flavobacterium saliperosum]|uniref:Uncharacterized protein n=1 Tax=Flavobacterium saliperosum TaxID=329186 RepID=A0A1G4W830_9FLAO|nr:hypothetical protein SAMN02927925_02673 [Flavobacterium saliperosum]